MHRHSPVVLLTTALALWAPSAVAGAAEPPEAAPPSAPPSSEQPPGDAVTPSPTPPAASPSEPPEPDEASSPSPSPAASEQEIIELAPPVVEIRDPDGNVFEGGETGDGVDLRPVDGQSSTPGPVDQLVPPVRAIRGPDGRVVEEEFVDGRWVPRGGGARGAVTAGGSRTGATADARTVGAAPVGRDPARAPDPPIAPSTGAATAPEGAAPSPAPHDDRHARWSSLAGHAGSPTPAPTTAPVTDVAMAPAAATAPGAARSAWLWVASALLAGASLLLRRLTRRTAPRS